ncbi:unnamed protein product, partial [Litomosoides sigmodontis]
ILTTVPPEITMQMPTGSATPSSCTTCKNLKATKIAGLKPNEISGPLAIEYSTQADGCRVANIVCGGFKGGGTARIYFNERIFLSDITGQAEVELICRSDSQWRAFESAIVVTSVSCVVIDQMTVPPADSPKVISTSSPFMLISTISMRCSAQWGLWGPWSTCSDICGAFGSRQRFRGCERTSHDCFCPGSISDSEYCNFQPCLYPRSACRQNHIVSAVNQKFVCTPMP